MLRHPCLLGLCLALVSACTSTAPGASNDAQGDSGSGADATAGTSNDAQGDSDTDATAGTSSEVQGDSGTDVNIEGPDVVGPPTQSASCTVVTSTTGLPVVATSLPGVACLTRGGNVTITVDAVDNAKDYRVYALPADGDLVLDGDGKLLGIQRGLYRCAGNRQAVKVSADGEDDFMFPGSLQTLVDNQVVANYQRPLSEATLGYVYKNAGNGRIPVYAAADPERTLGVREQRWHAALQTRYTTDLVLHSERIAEGWFDQGIVFYAPAPGEDTTSVYEQVENDRVLYFSSADEASFRVPTTDEDAFAALTSAAEGTLPLMRVFYAWDSYDGASQPGHDVLALGEAAFERIRHQGAELPALDLQWSGVTQETILVIEALDGLCPFQGQLNDVSYSDDDVEHPIPPAFAIDEVRAASPYQELFINGQNDNGTDNATDRRRPNAIARTFIKVAPQERPQLDFMSSFDPIEEPFQKVDNPPCSAENFSCDGGSLNTYASPNFDATINGTGNIRGLFQFAGELWSVLDDLGAAAQMRLTARQHATVAADSYLYVVMDVTGQTTARRYPMILINDVLDKPVWVSTRIDDANLVSEENGRTLTVQAFDDMPNLLTVESCYHRGWAVNNQCPRHDLERLLPWQDGSNKRLPHPYLSEVTGAEQLTRIEAFISSSLAYVYLDEKPYGCVELDPGEVPTGEVLVTFGNVIYHAQADTTIDSYMPNSFRQRQELRFDDRHFGFVGFSSGVGLPAAGWPATLPCRSAASAQGN